MAPRAVVVPCRGCETNVRVAFEEAGENGARREVACPRCVAPILVAINCLPATGVEVTAFSTAESGPGLRLARVETETFRGIVYYPVIFHRSAGSVSIPVMWPEPLPEVIYLGTSPSVREYRLASSGPSLVWYQE